MCRRIAREANGARGRRSHRRRWKRGFCSDDARDREAGACGHLLLFCFVGLGFHLGTDVLLLLLLWQYSLAVICMVYNVVVCLPVIIGSGIGMNTNGSFITFFKSYM